MTPTAAVFLRMGHGQSNPITTIECSDSAEDVLGGELRPRSTSEDPDIDRLPEKVVHDRRPPNVRVQEVAIARPVIGAP